MIYGFEIVAMPDQLSGEDHFEIMAVASIAGCRAAYQKTEWLQECGVTPAQDWESPTTEKVDQTGSTEPDPDRIPADIRILFLSPITYHLRLRLLS